MNKARQLLHKFLKGNTNPEEEIVVEHWYQHLLKSGEVNLSDLELENVKSRMHTRLMLAIGAGIAQPKTYRLPKFIIAAASVILIASGGLYSYYQYQQIKPGGDKATLTLADGSQIELDKNMSDQVVSQQGIGVKNTKSGWLEYFGKSKVSGINTLTIPRGGQYKVVLSDGTRVWVNSQTTLQYPTAFTGKTRKLKLTGEAFFEVTHDQNHPFIVELNGVNVTVLGTSFNIKAYPDEKTINTTVVTGLVGVNNPVQSSLVKPGQQAVYQKGYPLSVSSVDVDETMAWKNGLFKFNGLKISAIMQEISRWYDVDFEIRGELPDEELFGIIPRNEDISHVIEILEAAGNLHFETTGHKIIVTAPKK